MRHSLTTAAVLFVLTALVAGCAGDDLTARDYTVTTCPPRWGEGTPTAMPVEVCDRGVGATPRFVTVESCAADLGARLPESFALNGTHPDRARCIAQRGGALVTIADVARVVDLH